MKFIYALIFSISLVPAVALAVPISSVEIEPCVNITSDFQSNLITEVDKECMDFYVFPTEG